MDRSDRSKSNEMKHVSTQDVNDKNLLGRVRQTPPPDIIDNTYMSSTRNYDSTLNVQRYEPSRIYSRENSRRGRYVSLYRNENLRRVKPGSRSNRRHANYVENIRVRFSQSGTFAFLLNVQARSRYNRQIRPPTPRDIK